MDMKSTLNKFLDRNMEISVDKINMLVFNKKGKEKKEKWHWGSTEIEEMQEYKYLAFIFNKNENYKDYIKELGKEEKEEKDGC